MKKQTIYNCLQHQYNKLNQRIQKSMQTGRFYGYTQFKQAQLLNRLKRFSFQLKQLGAGVAVVAALGMATPVVGQNYNLVQQMGTSDPFNGISFNNKVQNTTFVDIDNDGDQDFFAVSYNNGSLGMQYFENTNNAASPLFVLQTTANNPLGSFSGIYDLAFVDIDGDGDYDVFSTNFSYLTSATFDYYENTGTATNPTYILQTGTSNPLDSVVTHLNSLNTIGYASAHPSFVDIDNDGDQDCFIGVGVYYGWAITANTADKLWYYENTGTDMIPDFQRTNNTNNPLGNIMTDPSVSTAELIKWGIQFIDGDRDGDQDALICIGNNYRYLKNEGTASAAMIQFSVGATPIDSLIGLMGHITYVDVDGDIDLDAVAVVTSFTANSSIYFYENYPYISINQLNNPIETIALYPNPTNGNITLDKPMTGQLNVFSVTGQKVYAQALETTQAINLSFLEEGTYLLSIEEDNKRYQQIIVIQK